MSAPATTTTTTPSYALGLDLGGSSVKGVAVTPDGQCLERCQRDFRPEVPRQWADAVKQCARDLAQAQSSPPGWIGLSAPGLASRDEASIAFMPGRLHGLEGFCWADHLRELFAGSPAAQVPVLNDAHSALLGEVWVGAARGLENVILLTLGTGVGGAAMVDGRLLRGQIGRAGHLGHTSLDPAAEPDICNTPGSLEMAMGNYRIRERTDGRFETTHALVRAVEAGDRAAERYWLHSVRQLAAAVASFVNILDPAAVIVGGGIARAGRTLFEPLARYLDAMEWRPGGQRVEIRPAQLGEFAGAFGAAYRALTAGQAARQP